MKRLGFLFLLCFLFVSLTTGQVVFGAAKPAAAKKRPVMKAAIDPNAYPGADEKELGQLRWVLKLADKPLAQADTLLDVRDKSVLPKYDATDNIKKPDLSKLRKSTIEDYQARDMYGLLKGDIAIGFVGRAAGLYT